MTQVRTGVAIGGPDTNNWTSINHGKLTRYFQRFGPYTATSVAANGGNTLATGASLPTGVTAAQIRHIGVRGVNDASNSAQFFVNVGLDLDSTNTTFDIYLRNLTTSTITFSSVYVHIELVIG